MTGEDIKNAFSKLSGIDIEWVIGDTIEGEYKNFAFIVNPNKVIVNNRISGDKPSRRSSKLKSNTGNRSSRNSASASSGRNKRRNNNKYRSNRNRKYKV